MSKKKEDKKVESSYRTGVELDEKSLEEFNNVWKEIEDSISFVYKNGENL